LRNILILQIVFVFISAIIAMGYGGLSLAQAILYGGIVAISSTLLMIWRSARCESLDPVDAKRHLRNFYLSFIERMVAVVGLLTLGFGPLALEPTGLLTGFVVGQLGLILAGFFDRKK